MRPPQQLPMLSQDSRAPNLTHKLARAALIFERIVDRPFIGGADVLIAYDEQLDRLYTMQVHRATKHQRLTSRAYLHVRTWGRVSHADVSALLMPAAGH